MTITRSLVILIAVFLVLLVGGSLLFAGCTVIPPGYVGIKVNLSGGNRGVEHYPILTGRQFYNPVNEKIYEYPIFLQTIVWTKDHQEGSPIDQSITFNSVEGAVVNVDVSLSYAFITDKVPEIFVAFRRTPQEITDDQRFCRRSGCNIFAREPETRSPLKLFQRPTRINLIVT